MAIVSAPIWAPTLLYPVKAAGSAYYRDELSRVAQNRRGRTSLSYFIVVLYPDNKNEHDANAVAVLTRGPNSIMLGHLPRDVAARYRQRMLEAGFEHQISACEAVLSGGMVAPDRVYDYVLELDLDLSSTPSCDHLVVNPELHRTDAYPAFKKDSKGEYRFKCWVPHDAVGNLDPAHRAIGWTTDAWNTVNYYLMDKSGVGLGFKVLSIPKEKHERAFGDRVVDAVVESISRRWVTLRLLR